MSPQPSQPDNFKSKCVQFLPRFWIPATSLFTELLGLGLLNIAQSWYRNVNLPWKCSTETSSRCKRRCLLTKGEIIDVGTFMIATNIVEIMGRKNLDCVKTLKAAIIPLHISSFIQQSSLNICSALQFHTEDNLAIFAH